MINNLIGIIRITDKQNHASSSNNTDVTKYNNDISIYNEDVLNNNRSSNCNNVGMQPHNNCNESNIPSSQNLKINISDNKYSQEHTNCSSNI